MPLVASRLPRAIGCFTLIQILRVDSIVGLVGQASAILHGPETLIQVSPARGNEPAMGFACLPCEDVDHSIHGVRSPDRSSRATNDFNSLDVFERQIQDLPEHTANRRR